MAEKPPKKTEQIKKDEKQPTEAFPGDSMGHEAKIQALQDALKRETARADAADREAKEWAAMVDVVQKTADAKDADVGALRSDLMLVEALAGGAPASGLNPKTELGKSATELVVELVHVNEQRRERLVEAQPAMSGWGSPRAKELVDLVQPSDRLLLLGDLLDLLAPHVGETGANEGAVDALKRKLAERIDYEERFRDADKKWERAVGDRDRITQDLAKLQAAMVARRAPDASAALFLETMQIALRPAADAFGLPLSSPGTILSKVMREWEGLRALLPKQSMVAVAVRDDSTKEIAERYSVGVLEWDGKAVKFDLLEGPARPWADLVRVMNHAVATRLVPPTFR